ncbi:hypothetical protein JGUZn3_20570 [Entomobacter blattae]|uniref:Putative exodeoxyribonuclease 8 PDDEXK-like domain-containing protein n=2 Tax=Entomobacter blattae TaxID=2762277 RepID=A0A7H1NU02_9PROT|nr:hypothetical protein JGUZn3_20570 [Entomobacter blattae]
MKDALENGHSEATVIWKEKDIYCRARVDFLPESPKGIPIDLKFTSLSAAPLAFSRTIQKEYATQAAFYLRGLRALGEKPKGFRFIVTETYAPYCTSVFECAPSLMEYADALIEEGIQRWRKAIKTNKLPSYPNTVCSVEATPWMMAEAEEKRFIYKEGFAA